jgi:hypothetical protein
MRTASGRLGPDDAQAALGLAELVGLPVATVSVVGWAVVEGDAPCTLPLL